MINFPKSELSFSQNVSNLRVNQLVQLLNVKAVENHDRDLGLPTIVGRSKTRKFNFLEMAARFGFGKINGC